MGRKVGKIFTMKISTLKFVEINSFRGGLLSEVGFCPGWAFVRWAFVQWAYVRWAYVRWAYVQVGLCPVGFCPVGLCPVGFCPRTA